MKLKHYIILFIFFFSNFANSQGLSTWKRARYEAVVGIGSTNFMGDLGGGESTSTLGRYIGDLDFMSTRPSAMIGMRYKLTGSSALKFNLIYGRLQADDANSLNAGRQARNLSFFSNIFEQSLYFEYSIIKENTSRKWSKRRKKKIRGFSTNLYTFLGVGGFWFNPKAEFEGKTYNLWEIGTEGQHIEGSGVEPYSRYNFAIPLGIGLKVGINKKIDIGVEYGIRYTFTDYIDNTGGSYYNNDAILAANDYDRAIGFLADNRISNNVFTEELFDRISRYNPEHPYIKAYKEGDRVPVGPIIVKDRNGEDVVIQSGSGMNVKSGPAKDMYMFLFFNVSYKLQTSRSGLPKFN